MQTLSLSLSQVSLPLVTNKKLRTEHNVTRLVMNNYKLFFAFVVVYLSHVYYLAANVIMHLGPCSTLFRESFKTLPEAAYFKMQST